MRSLATAPLHAQPTRWVSRRVQIVIRFAVFEDFLSLQLLTRLNPDVELSDDGARRGGTKDDDDVAAPVAMAPFQQAPDETEHAERGHEHRTRRVATSRGATLLLEVDQ
ncbi:MAG TPA: hypothetical protein VGU20_04800 [Stellaceae bacterium]|nr:hypothetical protein [Stellaceae bacterium]